MVWEIIPNRAGRTRRLTIEDDGWLVAPARQAPSGRLVTQLDGTTVVREEEGLAAAFICCYKYVHGRSMAH